MEKTKVALISCNNYEEEVVNECIKKGIDLIGGLSSIIKKDEKILIKPNLLKPVNPNKVTTTHPCVFGAVLKYLKDEGYSNITYGDSPAAGSNMSLQQTVEITQLKQYSDKYNVKLGDFENGKQIENPNGKYGKKFFLCNEVINSDALISVCKMKTHALVKITGAVKNQYGCIYSANKAIGHAKYPNSAIFSKMLIDLNKYIKPRLYIMDGIIAMEGNGPGSGDPVLMKTLLISTDPVAIDALFARLIDLKPEDVPTCYYGEKMGLGTYNFDNIDLLTLDGKINIDEAVVKYGNPNFVVNRKKQKFWDLKALFSKTTKIKHRPVVNLDRCVACGICENACPVEGKAVHSGNGKKAIYDYDKCIRCYCCQELCPKKAIERMDD